MRSLATALGLDSMADAKVTTARRSANGPGTVEHYCSPPTRPILAWLHGRPGHTLALPALERFYAVAAELGYANPMPQVRQLLGTPQIDSSQIT